MFTSVFKCCTLRHTCLNLIDQRWSGYHPLLTASSWQYQVHYVKKSSCVELKRHFFFKTNPQKSFLGLNKTLKTRRFEEQWLSGHSLYSKFSHSHSRTGSRSANLDGNVAMLNLFVLKCSSAWFDHVPKWVP